MHIFHDESGTFGKAATEGAFCAVACYVLPETQYTKAREVLRRFKLRLGKTHLDEVKRPDLGNDDTSYFELLDALGKLDGMVVALGTDASTNMDAGLHKVQQSRKFLERIDEMKHPEGREIVRGLARQIAELPDQNYVELYCRVALLWETIKRATMYYAQRRPGTLSKFRWSYDRKDLVNTPFETTFERVAPILLQSMAMEEPLPLLSGANYSSLLRRSVSRRPEWLSLRETSPSDGLVEATGIWKKKLTFVDSRGSAGVQLADLVVNGIFRVLRRRFRDNHEAARLLGRLMVHPGQYGALIPILRFSQGAKPTIYEDASALLRVMRNAARPMLVD